MLKNSLLVCIWICFLSIASVSIAQSNDSMGQTIEINTRLHSFVGKPSWLIVIRDLDNGQNIPYLFDFRRGSNYWLLFTRGRDYLIVASTLQMSTYKSRYNTFGLHKIEDFCHLESHGRIIHGESMSITVEGDLTSDPSTVTCNVNRFPDPNFTITKQSD